MDFVFVAMDSGPAKKLIFEALQQFGVPFVDAGMGIYLHDQPLLETSESRHALKKRAIT